MREQLDELARLQAAAMAEKTTLAICAYRRALLRDGDALLEYVRMVEGERDQFRAENERLREEVAGVRKVLRSRHCPPLNGETVAEAVNTAFCNAESHMNGLRQQRDNATARAEAAERERDEARKEAARWRETADNYAGHCDAACKQLEATETQRDEASQLLHAVSAILNPHDPYDPSKLLGWARDTVERAREADVAQAPEVTDAK